MHPLLKNPSALAANLLAWQFDKQRRALELQARKDAAEAFRAESSMTATRS